MCSECRVYKTHWVAMKAEKMCHVETWEFTFIMMLRRTDYQMCQMPIHPFCTELWPERIPTLGKLHLVIAGPAAAENFGTN